MLRQFRRETCMVKDHSGSGSLYRQLKPGYRIDAFGPASSAPSLDNAVVRYQLQVPSHDVAGEKRECAPNFAVNLRRAAARKRAELLGVQERLVNPLGTGFEILNLMDRPGRNNCFRFLIAGNRKTTKPDSTAADHLPPRSSIRRKPGQIPLIGHRHPR